MTEEKCLNHLKEGIWRIKWSPPPSVVATKRGKTIHLGGSRCLQKVAHLPQT